MIDIRGHFDGRVIIPDGPVDLPQNEVLLLHIQPLGSERERGMTAADLASSGIVGMWRGQWPGRDSADVARELRQQAQTRQGRP